MPDSWSPEAVGRLATTVTGCLCLLIVVLGTMIGVNSGVITTELLGTTKGLGIGGGLAGFTSIIYFVIRAGLEGGKRRGRR
jgi:hypothetical protein